MVCGRGENAIVRLREGERMRQIRRRIGLFSVAAVLVLAQAACSHGGIQTALKAPTGPSPLTSADPEPGKPDAALLVGPSGGMFKSATVSVVIPRGAVAAGSTIKVEAMPAAGDRSGEIFGQPVGVQHSKPLGKPLRLTWAAKGLTPWQLRTAVLAKWDDAMKTWKASSIPLTVRGNVLSAQVESFSAWDWIANFGQGAGEWTGTRADAPQCSGNPLPSWVQGVVNTDDDTKAAAILTCFEPDKNQPGVVTARVVDNRTFTQQLVMTGGGQRWAWTWPGAQSYGAADDVYTVAHAVFDTATTFLLPPLSDSAVGIARPAQPGTYLIAATARVNTVTVFVDLTAFVISQLTIGGTDNPLLEAFLEAGYKCAGSALLGHKTGDGIKQAVPVVVTTMADCFGQVGDPESQAGAAYQKIVQQKIAEAATDEERATIAKSYRTLDEASRSFKALTYGEVAFYIADQLQNAAIGPLTLAVRGRGTPQALGAWTPGCSSTKADGNALYKNLALQDEFADTRRELWQFPDWQPDAVTAVAPLARCSAAYRYALAAALPEEWGDKKAAGIVADAIRAIGRPAAVPSAPVTTAPPAGAGSAGGPFTPGSHFDDMCVVAWPTAPVTTSDSIQMTMSCEHVPEGKFLFTQVIYGNPNLQVTPGTGYMHIIGTVVGTAHSGYGFSELDVQASAVAL